jgi:uncharacterized membrane protein
MIIPSIPFPAHAQPSYLPGVHVGDSATFGQVSGNVTPFNVTRTVVETVTSVIGADVGLSLTFNYLNGSSQVLPFTENVQTQANVGIPLIIATGLKAGDPLGQPSSNVPPVTETVARVYGGAVRSVNAFVSNQTQSGFTNAFAFYWDQSSGLLMELSATNVQFGSPVFSTFHIKVTSTNVWNPSTAPDFSFDAIPLTGPVLYLGDTARFTLNLTSFQNFSGPVSLTSLLTNSSLPNPPILTLSGSSASVPSNGFATATLTFSTNSSTRLGIYLFSVHGVSGSLAHDTNLVLFVSPPSFALFATPANLTIAGGSSSTSKITARSLGVFSGSIALTASSNNPSITSSLNPTIVSLSSTVMSANSTLTVSVAPYILPGDFSVYVSGVSGQIQQSVNVPVTVSGPHFQLFLNTTFLTLPAGKSAAVSVTLQSISGFTGTVELTDSSYGPVAISLSQTNIFLSPGGTAKAFLTIFVPPSATPGSYLFASVTGISGLLQQNQGVNIQVAGSASGFSISSNPNYLNIPAGKTGNFTISLSSNGGFSGHVALGAQFNYGTPMGYVFSSTNVTLPTGGTATSTLTVSAPTTFPFGYSGLNVYANSGNVSQSLFLNINVGTTSFVAGPDFYVYSSPSSLTMKPGTTGNSTITISSINGFTGNLNLTTTQVFGPNCPGPTCPSAYLVQKTLNVARASSNSTILSVIVPSTTPTQSSYNLQVTASNRTSFRTTYISVSVCPCPGFGVSFNANNVLIIRGTSISPTIIVSSIQGFSGTVSLRVASVFGGNCYVSSVCPSVSLAPTSVFVPANGTATSTLTVATNSSTLTNSYYSVEVVANSTSETSYPFFSFNVISPAAPDFSLFSEPSPLIISPGTSGHLVVFLTSINGFSGNVTLFSPQVDFSVSPNNKTFTLASGGSIGFILAVSPKFGAPLDTYVNVQFIGTSRNLTRYLYLPVLVAAPDFNVVASQTGLTIQAGGNPATTTLTIPSLDGLQGTVALKASVQPCFNGVCPSVSFNPPNPSLSPGGWTLSNLTVSAPLGTSPGGYQIAVNATSGSVSHIISLSVYVSPSTIQIPDFSIFASPSFLTIAQGGSHSSTITLTSVNGFKGTLILTSTATSGINASLASPSLQLKSGGTNATTLNASVPSTTPTGFYYVTVTGTNGTISHTVTISVQVVGPDFSISAQPSIVTVPQGKSGLSTVTVTSLAGFAGTVNLSVSGNLPASFSKSSLILSSGGTMSSNLTISGFTTYPGLYYLTVTAFSGTVSHYATIVANVTGPDFTISAKPTNLTIEQGRSGFSTITLKGIEGFSGPILLSASNYYYYYAQFQTSVTPSSVTLNSTTTTATASLNVTVPANLIPGSFNYVVVTGTNGILSHTIYIPVTVKGPDFSLTARTPFLGNLHQGSNTTSIINLSSLDGFHGIVNLNATSYGGLTVSVNSTITLTSGGTGNATLRISSTNATVLGGHYVYVTGTNGLLTHYVYVYVNVTGPDFSMSTSQYSFTLMRGQHANSTFTFHSVDQFTGTVKLTATTSGANATTSGIKATLSSASVTLTPTTSASSILSISVNSTVPNGFYYIYVTGTSGILSHTTYIYVNVVGPDFTISAYPGTYPYYFSVQQGQTSTLKSTITLTSFYGLAGNVTLSVSPDGLGASLSKTSLILTAGGSATDNLTITVPANITLGYHPITVQAVNGTIVRTVTVYVYVYPVPKPDFSVSVVPSSETLLAGTTGNYSVILTSQTGFNGTVSLNATLTNGFTAVFSPQKLTIPAGGQVSATLAITIPSRTLTGLYYVLVTATNSSGNPVHTIYVGANVLAQNFTLSAVPTFLTVQAGSTGKSIVAAVGLNGFSGTVGLTLGYNTQQITASLGTSSLKIASGFANSTVLTISTSTSTVPGTYQIVVNGTIGTLSRQVTVTVQVTPSPNQPTVTTLACNTPIKVNMASTCTATVMSTATSGVTTPSGRVDLITNSTSGFFTPYCFLAPTGTNGLARCAVLYAPTVIGHILVTAAYAGDSAHLQSSANFTLTSTENVVVLISGPSTGNEGSPLSFTAFVSGGTLPFTFNWSAPRGSPSTGSTVGFTTTYNSTGLFTISVNATDAVGNSGITSANVLIFPSGGQKLSLTVLVFNATAVPIQGSTVVATTATTTNSSITDVTGSSVFTLSPGIYNVTASGTGYLSASQIVDLVSNQTIALTLSNPYIFLGQIPATHLSIQPVTGGFTVTLTNMFANSPSDIVFDWHFMGILPANATQSFFFDHLPQLIVMSALKGSVDYPHAWYAQPLPPGLNATTGQEGAFLPEANPYNANSIFIIPNPPTAGQVTQIGVTLHNPFNHTLIISRIDFQVATLNIGTSTWQSVGQISNVTLAPGETRTFSVNWIATKSAHLCVRVVLNYSPSGIQVLQKNLVILNGNSVTFMVGDPFGFGGDFTLGFGSGNCVANINGQLVTSTITLHLAAGQQLSITLSGNCNVSESFGGSNIGGVVTLSSTLPDVELICPPSGFVGQPVTCSANVSGDITGYTFLWSTDGTPSSGTDSIFTTIYSTPGLHTVTVTLTSGSNVVSKSAQIMIFGNGVTVGSTVVVSAPGVTGATAYDNAKITLANATATAPTGNLRYDFYSTSDCSGTSTSQTVTLGAASSVPNSSKQGPLAAGSYSFKANYLGDTIYIASSSSCESFTVNKAPTTVTTQVMNSGTSSTPSGNEITGSSFFDTSTLKGAVSGFTVTGTVSYVFYSTKDCSGTSSALPDVTLNADGSVPSSSSTDPLHAGNYSFTATYNGDNNYLKSPASGCETFTVHRAPTTVTTQIINNANGLAPFGTEVTGSSFHDTATLGGAITGFTPTGTATYSLYSNSTCAGTLVSPSQAVTLTAIGSVPDSNSSGPLAAGNYRYQSAYSGDRDYLPSPPSPCETLKVLKAPTTTTTTLINTATGGLPTGTEVTGSRFNDNATIFGAIVGFTPGGNVRYQFWTNNSCSLATGTSEILGLTAMGGAPMSSMTRRLGAGNYSFQADYGGDSNYLPSQSTCEKFAVLKAPTTTYTQVISGATGRAPTGNEVAGAVFFDTATVLGVNGFTVTGSIQYQFFTNSNCSGSASTTTVSLSNGLVPNSTITASLGAGGYSYTASYSGDGNYTGSNSSGPTCESFNVARIKPTVTTTLTPAGTVLAGQSVSDQANFSPSSTFNPTGSVVYTLTQSGTCSGPGVVVATVTLNGGKIPSSGSVPMIQAGTFGFNATYSGDANNLAATSACEVITVNTATPSITTSLSSSVIVARSSAFDTATLSGTSGSNTVGVVTYFVFTTSSGTSTGGCTGTAHTVSAVNVGNSVVPTSRSVLFNRTGTYGWDAVYSGDSNNNGATSSCETLTVTNAGSVYFNLTASPQSVIVNAGTRGTSTITLNSFNGFGRPVTLSFKISPSTGLTCTLSRTRITGGSGISTLSCTGSTGVYQVIVTGTAGPLSSSVTVAFNVTSTVGPLACATGCAAPILTNTLVSQLSGSSSSTSSTADRQKGRIR